MKNRAKIFAPFVAGLLVCFFAFVPNTAHASLFDHVLGAVGIGAIDVVGLILSPIILQALALSAFAVYVTGAMLNYTLYLTIIQMAKNLSVDGGYGATINEVWTAVRDVANMLFIFALLYTAIMTIFGKGDYKRTILNLIIAALLINFSLFFTKVIIDVANYLALVFYTAIVPGVTTMGLDNAGSFFGIANVFVAKMGLPLIYDAKNLGTIVDGSLVTQAVLGSIVLVIVAFTFFFVTILFVIRYVVLILVMILSPLMFVSLILPRGMEGGGYTKKWWDALIGQAFFAPAYFFLTWITIKVINGILTAQQLIDGQGNSLAKWSVGSASGGTGSNPAVNYVANNGLIATVFNFVIIIAFLIATITITKSVANRSGGWMSSVTKWAGGAAGGATLGLAGRYGRGTIGRAGAAVGDSEKLKNMAANGNAVTSRFARLSMAAGRKTSEQSFDIRGGSLGNALGGGKAQKGGFAKDIENQTKARKKFADSLKPSDVVVNDAENELVAAQASGDKNRVETAQKRVDTLKGINQKEVNKRRADLENDKKDAIKAHATTKTVKDLEREIADRQAEINKTIIPEMKAQRERDLEEAEKNLATAKEAAEAAQKDLEAETEAKKDQVKVTESIGNLRKLAYATDLETAFPISTDRVQFLGSIKRENRAAALEIRKSIKEKKPAEKIFDELKKQVEEDSKTEAPPPAPTPEPGPGTPPTTP